MLIVPPQIQYVDDSQWQASFDLTGYPYPKIAHRATFGPTGTDPAFAGRWQLSSHLVRQAYHFAYPGDGTGEADHFLAVVDAAGGFHPGDEAMLDLETLGVTPAQAAVIAPAWFDAVGSAYPDVRLLVYGNSWFIEAAGLTAGILTNVGLIVASYGAPAVVPSGWPHVCVQQTTDTAVIPGFAAPVDLNTVICPSQLEHLTIGDTMSQADIDAINAHIDTKIGAAVSEILQLVGDRLDAIVGPNPMIPGTGQRAAAPASLGALAETGMILYGRQKPDGTGPVDPSHKGMGDIYSATTALPGAFAAEVAKQIPAVQLDTAAITTAVQQAVAAELAAVTGTVTLTPKAAS